MTKEKSTNLKRLRQLRKNIVASWSKKMEGKKITEISKKSGVSRATIWAALNGYHLPNFNTIDRIEAVLKHFKG